MDMKKTGTMVDMKMAPSERKKMMDAPESEAPAYPWGLQLRLENAELDKLGVKSMPAPGTMFMVHAMCEVTSATESKSKDNDGDRGVQLQVMKMQMMPHKDEK